MKWLTVQYSNRHIKGVNALLSHSHKAVEADGDYVGK
jgi:hypothetical protein